METITPLRLLIKPFKMVALLVLLGLSWDAFSQCNAAWTSSSSQLSVTFTPTNQDTTYTHYWLFGDNTTSSQISPVKSYANYGTYHVTHILSKSGCWDSLGQTITLTPPPCSASFSDTTSWTGVTHFMNSSSAGSGATYFWTFGDGNWSTASWPTHSYAQPGTYTVCLTVTYNNCTDTFCKPVVISNTPPPSCNASFIDSFPGPANMVWFSSNSSGTTNNTTYYWSFGDGTFGNGAFASHTYLQPGPYLVCLNIMDSLNGCFDSACKVITIPGTQICYASFQDSFPGPANMVWFSSNSTGTMGSTKYSWSFGDGSFGSWPFASHTYGQSGSYLVCLTIMDSLNGCWDSTCRVINVGTSNGCNAAFTWHQDSVSGAIVFVNHSTGTSQNSTLSYQWNFGDYYFPGNNSTAKNTSYHYLYNGTYIACLTITQNNPSCTSTFCDTITVVHGPKKCRPFIIAYQGQSDKNQFNFMAYTGDSTIDYSWSFGDGNTSNLSNPSHRYTFPGTYIVCVTTVRFDGCTSTSCDTVVVPNDSIVPCHAAFTYTLSGMDTLSGAIVNFQNQSTGNNLSYYWTLGSGTSTQANPSWYYPIIGNYVVCLVVYNPMDSCRDSICQIITIPPDSNYLPCNAAFSYTLYPDSFDGVKRIAVFSNQSTGNNLSYYWTFGDASSSGHANPMHHYPLNGNYLVCLVVYNMTDSCVDSTCQMITIAPDSSTGLGQLTGISDLRLYPVPFNDVLKVTLNSTTSEDIEVKVVNMLGILQHKEIRAVDKGNNEFELGLEHLKQGIYLIELSTSKGSITKRIIK